MWYNIEQTISESMNFKMGNTLEYSIWFYSNFYFARSHYLILSLSFSIFACIYTICIVWLSSQYVCVRATLCRSCLCFFLHTTNHITSLTAVLWFEAMVLTLFSHFHWNWYLCCVAHIHVCLCACKLCVFRIESSMEIKTKWYHF